MAANSSSQIRARSHWTLAERLAHYSSAPNERGCILWTGHGDQQGYGVLKMRGKTFRAHRVAWELINGPIPVGLNVLHSCDVPGCVNAIHLRVGTHADNHAEREQKGRGRRLHGEDHPGARITRQQADEIKNDSRPQKIIAKAYGISQTNVSYIRSGKRWVEHGVVFRDRKRQ